MINFLRYRLASALFSIALIVASAVVYIQQGGFRYSVDFTGGTEALLKFDQAIDTAQVRAALSSAGWQNVDTRGFSDKEMAVRLSDDGKGFEGMQGRLQQSLAEAIPANKAEVLRIESVGSSVGQELRWKSLQAILFAILLMLIYIAWRFWSVAFAVGAVVALLHDALVMLAAFLLFDRTISVNVIGAILTVIGYSINDTIVIFSQIKHNIKVMRGKPLDEVVNISLNQTLKRTLLTSISTGLTVGAMFILGGEALRDFSLALLVGIIFGTYSSVYIASPVMMLLYKKED